MHPDGSTFIDRIEGIEPIRTITGSDNDTAVKKADVQRHQAKPIFYIKWTLGELLFNRHGRAG